MNEHLRPVSKKLKNFAKREGMKCVWCRQDVQLGVPCMHPMAPTREHIVPLAIKPKHAAGKTVLAHSRCNNLRGIADEQAYRSLMDGEAVTKYELWPTIFRLM